MFEKRIFIIGNWVEGGDHALSAYSTKSPDLINEKARTLDSGAVLALYQKFVQKFPDRQNVSCLIWRGLIKKDAILISEWIHVEAADGKLKMSASSLKDIPAFGREMSLRKSLIDPIYNMDTGTGSGMCVIPASVFKTN